MIKLCYFIILGIVAHLTICDAFTSFAKSLNRQSFLLMTSKELYGIDGASWTSSKWNWGYAVGTGHDCAAICRRKFETRDSREEWIRNIACGEICIEEIKLVLALAWQKGRWDGSDGGEGGYGEVLEEMIKGFYDTKDEEENARMMIIDLASRYPFISESSSELDVMEKIANQAIEVENMETLESLRFECCEMVLKAMGFVERGL